jgi:hypothetical protein
LNVTLNRDINWYLIYILYCRAARDYDTVDTHRQSQPQQH